MGQLTHAGHMLDGIFISARQPITDNVKVGHLQLVSLNLLSVYSLGVICVKRFVFKGVIGIFKVHIFTQICFLSSMRLPVHNSEAVIMNGMEIIRVPRGQPPTMLYSEGKMVSRNL